MAGNSDFNNLATTTYKNHQPSFVDGIENRNVLLFSLRNTPGAITTKDGGTSIVEPIMHAELPSGLHGSYSDYDAINNLTHGRPTTAYETVTAAEYPWAGYGATMHISNTERRKNSGKNQIIDLLKAKQTQLEVTVDNDFDEMFFGDGTGNSSKDMLGLAALVGDNSSSVTTVGGINATTNAFWRSYVDRTGGVPDLPLLNHAYYKAKRGTVAPNLTITTMELYEFYESLLQPQQRFTSADYAQAGFETLAFKGGSVVAYGDNVTEGDWFNVNTKFLKLVKHSDAWADSVQGFYTPSGLDVSVQDLVWMGQLICNNRRVQSKLEDLTTS